MANELLSFKTALSDFSNTGSGRILGKSRYIKPPKCKEIPDRLLKYEFAIDLARDMKPESGMRAFVVLDGKFIAGDFVEALFVTHNLHAKRVIISTLSLSENNVDSLANLLNGQYIDSLDLIVSDYFFSHERRNLIPYLYQELDKNNKFQLAAASTHCKLCLIEFHDGKKIVMHGSANLRSSSNIEHICIEESPDLYEFNLEIQAAILEKYKTIQKSVRYETLWQAVQANQKEKAKKPVAAKKPLQKSVHPNGIHDAKGHNE